MMLEYTQTLYYLTAGTRLSAHVLCGRQKQVPPPPAAHGAGCTVTNSNIGEALADMSMSGQGRKREGREGRREVKGGGGRWRRELEGGGGRGRTEAHSYKLFG